MGRQPEATSEDADRVRGLLALLESFYAAADHDLPAAEPVEPAAMPPIYRRLLVHDQDMTGTLEAFVGARLHVRPISIRRSTDTLEREVLLASDGDDRPVEFGAIRIHLDRLAKQPRQRVLEGIRPLGAILNESRTVYSCAPNEYFRLPSDEVTGEAFRLDGAHTLYGRHNLIYDGHGAVLAEVVEILPPLDDRGASGSSLNR
ncbi:MAG: hypothetical protein ACYTJ0_10830 [Planctomycetota bacterium]